MRDRTTDDSSTSSHLAEPAHRVGSDVPFYGALIFICAFYAGLILAMLLADVAYMRGYEEVLDPQRHPYLALLVNNPLGKALAQPEIQYSIWLSLLSSTASAILSLWVAVPVGYLLSRHVFPGKNLLDALLDIPIVLPPLVVGLSLLILFQFAPVWLRERVVYEKPAVVLAQFAVACAFAVRTLRATFDQIDPRREQVALTLGCTRAQAFARVVLPETKAGVITAGTLAWARALGEFGPLLIFAGATRGKTEVLSTTVFLELSIGNLKQAVAVSLLMVIAALVVLVITRLWGSRSLTL